MIFSPDMAALVLSGRKTQTRRPVKFAGDVELPCRYKPGCTYAVQPGRGRREIARIRVLAVRREAVEEISDSDVEREGFHSRAGFEAKWSSLHGRFGGPVWAIEFEVTEMRVRGG